MESRRNELKEPWRAVFLSSFLPGLGECYVGRPWRGALFLLAFAIAAAALLVQLFALIYIPRVVPGFREAAVVLGLASALAALYLLSFIDGYTLAKNRNKACDIQLPADRKKAPWLSAFLSRFVPGLGQLYNGDLPGAILHAAAWAAAILFFRASWLLAATGAITILSMVNAYNGAVKANGGGPSFGRQLRPWGIALAAVWILLPFLAAAVVTHSCLFRIYRIPGGAMRPCLLANDRVLVDTVLFRFTGVRRGDVLMFNAPDKPGKWYTKRVVGMPGETIEIREGRVIINGKPLPEGNVIGGMTYDYYGAYCRPGEALRIPEGCYFFLGDRRENSLDSRIFGPVQRGEIVGRVIKIVRPRRRVGPVR